MVEQDCLQVILTLKEAAQLWSMPEDTLRRACLRGQFADGETRKSGGTWLITREALEERYGPPGPHRGLAGVPLAELMAAYGLGRQSDVLERRDEFGPRELWREGRKWYVMPAAMDKVFGSNK